MVPKARTSPGGHPKGSQSSGIGKQDETNGLGVIDIPLKGMVDLSTKFVEEALLLGATILTELNKLKTDGPKEKVLWGFPCTHGESDYPAARLACSSQRESLAKGWFDNWKEGDQSRKAEGR